MEQHYIENWREFVGYLSKPTAHGVTVGYTRNFHGCKTPRETIDLALNGWKGGIKQVELFSSLLDNEIKGSLRIDEYYYNVSGQDFDLDRVLIGEPEAWLNSEQVEVKAPATHTVRLVINGATHALVSSTKMIARGACLVALVQLLERGRKRVEIELIFNVSSYPKKSRIVVPLKSAGEDLDLNKVTFALAHPDCCRRLQFAVWDAKDKRISGWGYGEPKDLNSEEIEQEEIGIYIGQGYDECNFLDFEASKKWILAELKKQGVELKNDY